MLGENPRERVSVGHSETQRGAGRDIKTAGRDRKRRDKRRDREIKNQRDTARRQMV